MTIKLTIHGFRPGSLAQKHAASFCPTDASGMLKDAIALEKDMPSTKYWQLPVK